MQMIFNCTSRVSLKMPVLYNCLNSTKKNGWQIIKLTNDKTDFLISIYQFDLSNEIVRGTVPVKYNHHLLQQLVHDSSYSRLVVRSAHKERVTRLNATGLPGSSQFSARGHHSSWHSGGIQRRPPSSPSDACTMTAGCPAEKFQSVFNSSMPQCPLWSRDRRKDCLACPHSRDRSHRW